MFRRDAIEVERLREIERAADVLVEKLTVNRYRMVLDYNDQDELSDYHTELDVDGALVRADTFESELSALRSLLDARESDRQAWLKAHGFK